MESTYRQGRAAPPAEASVTTAARVRCSIILPPFGESPGLRAYLDELRGRDVRGEYEVLISGAAGSSLSPIRAAAIPSAGGGGDSFDACATTARGAYLLFVRQLVHFDIALLEESIQELERTGNELSVSNTGKFILVRRSLYRRVGRLDALLERIDSAHIGGEPTASGSGHDVRFPEGEHQPLTCGANTSIDPDVVIDSPDHVRIGTNCVIRRGVVFRPESGEIVIGDNCRIDHYCVFHGDGGIYIGDWSVIAPHCSFHAKSHGYDRFDVPLVHQQARGRGIYLMGDNYIGAGTVVCDDVSIGKGAMIAPNSTVAESLPMACMAGGAPARPTGKRHRSGWDTRKEERAVSEGMPENVCRHVMNRALLIQQWIEPQDRVLDVGCGEGIITAVLADQARSIIGCDYSSEAVGIAAERHPDIEFACCNSTNLPFGAASFDKVTMSDVAEHLLPVQFKKTLQEIHRVLLPGGMLILATPLTGKGGNGANYAHIYEYSESEIERTLDELFCDVRLVDKEFGLMVGRKRRTSRDMAATELQKGACRSYGGESTS